MSIDGSDVEIGSDLVGRDKVVHQTVYVSNRDKPKSQSSRRLPWLLPYMVDRREQQRRLSKLVQNQIDRPPFRPLAFFIVGADDECPEALVQQIYRQTLPQLLDQNGLGTSVIFKPVRWAIDSEVAGTFEESEAEVASDLKEQVLELFGRTDVVAGSILERRLTQNPHCCLFHLDLDVSQWGNKDSSLLLAWLKWLTDLNSGRMQTPIVVLLTLGYPVGIAGILKSKRHLVRVRKEIRRMARDSKIGGCIHELPQLGKVALGDMEHWIREHIASDESHNIADHEILRRAFRRDFSILWGLIQRTLPMFQAAEVAKKALTEATTE